MGLMKSDGSDEINTEDLANAATGSPNLPPNINDCDPTRNAPNFQTDNLENYPVISDPAYDRMAFDVSQYPDSYRRLQAYMQGHRWHVTYFSQMGGGGDVRTNISDYPNERNIANSAYMKIRLFELTLQGPMQFEYDPTKGDANATGQALIYSGFVPQIGDFFVGSVGDNKLGIFRVSATQPLSWRADRVHQIGYYFYNYADPGNLQFLESATKERTVFDKASYMGGTYTLLEEDYYRDLQELRRFKEILAKYYFSLFYNTGLNTFTSPVGQYDPYVVKYMASTCPFSVVHARPQQLWPNTDLTYCHTLWSRLSDRVNTTIDDLWPFFFNPIMSGYGNGIMLTPLLNKGVTVVVPRNSPQVEDGSVNGYYVLSSYFYSNDTDNMTPLEQLVWKTIKTRNLSDTSYFLSNFLRQYLTLTPQDAFYTIPLYMKLIDIAIPSISRKAPSTPF